MNSIYKPYNKLNIIKFFGKQEALKENGSINTYIKMNKGDKKLISSWKPKNNNYKIIPFIDIAKRLIKCLESQGLEFTEQSIRGGAVQDLRLCGAKFTAKNGDVYQDMVSLISSTDGTRTLQFFAGAMRQICSNGMMAPLNPESSFFKAKHLESNEGLTNFLENFESMVIEQCKIGFSETRQFIDKLVDDKKVKFSQLRDIMTPGELKAFAVKLISSKTDRLATLTEDDKKSLRDVEVIMNPEFDFELPITNTYQCFTEIFRRNDSGIIYQKSSKLLKALEEA